MIAGSVADDNEVALTFGLLTAAAVACLMVATAVGTGATGGAPEGVPDEEQARRVERLVEDPVAGGAEEPGVRELAAEAIRLGRGVRRGKSAEEEEGRG